MFCFVCFLVPITDVLDTPHICNISWLRVKHWLTKVCILSRISLATSHFSHSYKSTDFKQALKVFMLVYFLIDVDSHRFLCLENGLPRRVESNHFTVSRRVTVAPIIERYIKAHYLWWEYSAVEDFIYRSLFPVLSTCSSLLTSQVSDQHSMNVKVSIL
jgi:hypothetical protein